MTLYALPTELITDIISLALEESQIPSWILAVDSRFFAIAQPLLHSHLQFRSSHQLGLFSKGLRPLACLPSRLTLVLPGGMASLKVFENLHDALSRCNRQQDASEQVALNVLRLQLNSHIRDPNIAHIEKSLSLANPTTFIWTGPDPEHHFSTAIVPAAVKHLFTAISAWSHIHHIKLTNISFPSVVPSESNNPESRFPRPGESLLPPIPSLQTLLIGQAIFLSPGSVASMVCSKAFVNLQQVRLIDTYSESIWGLRIRRSDIEKAGVDLLMAPGARLGQEGIGENTLRDVVLKIRALVTCERATERIEGGDRVEGASILI